MEWALSVAVLLLLLCLTWMIQRNSFTWHEWLNRCFFSFWSQGPQETTVRSQTTKEEGKEVSEGNKSDVAATDRKNASPAYFQPVNCKQVQKLSFSEKASGMEQRCPEAPRLPAESPCPMKKTPPCGDEELDEETVNYLSALYAALGPLLPEVTSLQSDQDPPVHLMVDLKAKLRQMGCSISEAKKLLLQYNVYLKKQLLKVAQEQKSLPEQQREETGKQELPQLESPKPKPKASERVQRRTGSCQASLGEDSKRPQREPAEEQTGAFPSPPGPPRSVSRRDTLSARTTSDRSLM